MDNIGINHSDQEINIDCDTYMNGSFILAFDLSPGK